jgi:uncharacterized membrane protein YhaH (DUF805 family)
MGILIISRSQENTTYHVFSIITCSVVCSTRRVPLHCGNLLQPANIMPFGPIRFFIGDPHLGHVYSLIFFIGFIILLVLSLILTINISKQKSTIITLVQELALTNKRLEDLNASNNKKSNRKI